MFIFQFQRALAYLLLPLFICLEGGGKAQVLPATVLI